MRLRLPTGFGRAQLHRYAQGLAPFQTLPW
jgi:hypothetical protein